MQRNEEMKNMKSFIKSLEICNKKHDILYVYFRRQINNAAKSCGSSLSMAEPPISVINVTEKLTLWKPVWGPTMMTSRYYHICMIVNSLCINQVST